MPISLLRQKLSESTNIVSQLFLSFDTILISSSLVDAFTIKSFRFVCGGGLNGGRNGDGDGRGGAAGDVGAMGGNDGGDG